MNFSRKGLVAQQVARRTYKQYLPELCEGPEFDPRLVHYFNFRSKFPASITSLENFPLAQVT